MDGAAERGACACQVLVWPEQAKQRVAAVECGCAGSARRSRGQINQQREPLGLCEDRPELATIRTAQIQDAERAKLYQEVLVLADGRSDLRGESQGRDR
jgi:hypothetical protein